MTQYTMEQALNMVNLAKNGWLLSDEKSFIFHSMVNSKASDHHFELKNEIASYVNQMRDESKEIEELFESIEALNDKISNNERSEIKNKKQLELLKYDYEREEKKFVESEKLLEKIEKQDDMQTKHQSEFVNNQTHESLINILNNDHKIFAQIFKSQEMLIDSLTNYSERINLSQDILLKKHFFNILLNGLNIIEDKTSTNKSNWFEIQMLNLADDCLDEQYFSLLPDPLKNIMLKLSPALMDKYRAIFKKRKMSKINNNANNPNETLNINEKKCVTLNDLTDYETLFNNYTNYISILCSMMTKTEIEKVKKVPIDWVFGSQIITILLSSKGSTMANIQLPKYYPLTGTSRIKVLTITGCEDSELKNFQVKQNFDSFSEWLTNFIDLYYKIKGPAQ